MFNALIIYKLESTYEIFNQGPTSRSYFLVSLVHIDPLIMG